MSRYPVITVASQVPEGAMVIPLWRGRGIKRAIGWCLIDPADYGLVSDYEWFLNLGYATRADGSGGCVRMHRQILGLEPGDSLHGHHINGLRVDNRRANLAAVPAAEHGAMHGHGVSAVAA